MATLLRPHEAAGIPEAAWDDVQGDILGGLPAAVQAFLFLELSDVRAFKAALRRSLAKRATSARTARLWSMRPGYADGSNSVGLNIGFTALGCAKLAGDAVPPDPAFRAGAYERARAVGDPEPALNWLPQVYGSPVDAVVVIAGGTLKAVDAEWRMLQNVLTGSARVCYREVAERRPAAQCERDHFGHATGSGAGSSEGGRSLVFLEAPDDAAPFPWMRHGTYAVVRRIEQLVPEYEERSKAIPFRDVDGELWRASGLAWRAIPFGPEVSDLERSEGKTTADRGRMFVSYQTSLADFERLQRRCVSPNSYAINSGSAYVFVPSISALAGRLAH
jgi:deferrochelatase/peroxidase EfeB